MKKYLMNSLQNRNKFWINKKIVKKCQYKIE